MPDKKLLRKHELAVYSFIVSISVLFSVIALTIFKDNNDVKSVLINLATEFFGAGVIYFVVQRFFGLDDKNEIIENKVDLLANKLENKDIDNKLDSIIQEFNDNKNYKIIDRNNKAFNEDFYKYFNEKILNAKHNVFMTGEGFEFPEDNDNTDKLKIARDFIETQRKALQNNPELNIVRLQTEPNISDKWNEDLKSLVIEFPKRFGLHLKTNIVKSDSIASVCTIDEEDDIDNITEFMYSTKSNIGTTTTNIAGLSIFIRGNRQLCGNVLSYMKKEIDDKLTIKIDADNFDLHMTESILYFAFGSNMNVEQMVNNRCKSAKKISNGYIDDYELVFNREGTSRKGGVSSIIYKEEKKVYGVVYLINLKDKKKLDSIEEEGNAYKQKMMNVVVLDEENNDNHKQYLECLVYISNPQKGEFKPSEEYITTMISGAEHHKLPDNYIKFLKSFKN
ncbi:gamma-glutamylcyclotransferase family protein [Winogradskyella sp. PE311]|uniref:gamma-glutamylcyclotransferase family protein n=1 Tax=Winogradskyella sp. PE311 TaxID=3366943 RepID=UPI00397EAE83